MPAMRLQPLYRVRLTYPESWHVVLTGPRGAEGHHLFMAEGRCEGRISGRFRALNHPRSRTDGVFTPDLQGVIETDDGATILLDHRGYGRTYPAGRRQVVATGTHLCGDDRYRWLNDVVCVGAGEVRETPEGETEIVIDIAELLWEPLE